jgi:hypothetical protein
MSLSRIHAPGAIVLSAAVCGVAALLVSGLAPSGGAAEEGTTQDPGYEKQITILYTVNNLAFVDTCG